MSRSDLANDTRHPISASGQGRLFRGIDRAQMRHLESPVRWGENLGDDVVAAATIDRHVHHAHVIGLDGDSYRTRGHRRQPTK